MNFAVIVQLIYILQVFFILYIINIISKSGYLELTHLVTGSFLSLFFILLPPVTSKHLAEQFIQSISW